MALTVRRAALLTAAGCALIAVAYLPPEARLAREFGANRWWSRASFELRTAETGLFVLEYRDSLLATMRRHPGDPLVVSVYAHGILPDSAAAAVQRAFGTLVPGTSTSGVRTGVALIVQRAPGGPAWNEDVPAPGDLIIRETINYLPMLAPGSDLCLTVATVTLHPRVRSPSAALAAWLARTDQDLVGPCWYVREFGPPGPGIAPWLAGGGASYATRFSGTRPQATKRERPVWLRAALGFEDRPFELDFMPHQARSFADLSCLNGRTDRCRDVIVDPLGAGVERWFGFWRTDVPGVVSLPGTRARSDDRWLLADLLAAKGRERFTKFWKSSLPFDSAFADAFGKTPGKWMRAWVETNLGPATYPPWPATHDVVLTVAVILVLTMAGGAMRHLRQMG